MLKDESDKTFINTSYLVYKNENLTKVFQNRKTGVVLSEESGVGKIPFDRIISYRRDLKSVALCMDEDVSHLDEPFQQSIWVKFISWYKTKKEDS